jgi:hypothetical protein
MISTVSSPAERHQLRTWATKADANQAEAAQHHQHTAAAFFTIGCPTRKLPK